MRLGQDDSDGEDDGDRVGSCYSLSQMATDDDDDDDGDDVDDDDDDDSQEAASHTTPRPE